MPDAYGADIRHGFTYAVFMGGRCKLPADVSKLPTRDGKSWRPTRLATESPALLLCVGFGPLRRRGGGSSRHSSLRPVGWRVGQRREMGRLVARVDVGRGR
jgi:hypothetical protein